MGESYQALLYLFPHIMFFQPKGQTLGIMVIAWWMEGTVANEHLGMNCQEWLHLVFAAVPDPLVTSIGHFVNWYLKCKIMKWSCTDSSYAQQKQKQYWTILWFWAILAHNHIKRCIQGLLQSKIKLAIVVWSENQMVYLGTSNDLPT